MRQSEGDDVRTGMVWTSTLTTTWLPEVTYLKTMAEACMVRFTSKSGNTVVDLLQTRITGEKNKATTASLFVSGRSIAVRHLPRTWVHL